MIRRIRFGDSNTFSLTTDTGASGESGLAIPIHSRSIPLILVHPESQPGDSTPFTNTTDTGASGEFGFGDSNTF